MCGMIGLCWCVGGFLIGQPWLCVAGACLIVVQHGVEYVVENLDKKERR